MTRSAAAPKIPPSRQDAVRSSRTFFGERAVKLRLYGRSSKNFCIPAGVFNARNVRSSDGVKPKPDESPSSNIQPPKNHQQIKHQTPRHACHPERSEGSQMNISIRLPNKPEMFRFAQHDTSARQHCA